MMDPGRNAYGGFEYQIRVSAWLAAVFLRAGGCTAVVIEPLGGEDLAALDPASAVDTSGKSIVWSAGEVLVQIKSRATGAWGNEDLSAVLAGKDPTTKTLARVRPLEELKAHRTKQFLFVTEASVNGDLGPLKVESPLFAPRQVPQGSLTATLKNETDELRGRIGILPGQLPAALDREARDVLVREWHVPRLDVERCHTHLLERIRDGLRSAARGTLSATELQALVRTFGGEPDFPEPFVEPSSFGTLRSMLDEHYALLLLGEPGVGKTTAARRLGYEHRMRSEPFALVEVTDPAELQRYASEAEPILVYVEDPFGRDRHEASTGNAWALALDHFLARATSSRRLVVTSRESFATPHVLGDRTPRLHAVQLTLSSEGYDRSALLEELENREPGLDDAGRAWIHTKEERILATLARPLSFERLIARAAHVPTADRTLERLQQIIEDARNAEFGPELEETFRDRPNVELRGLVVLWIGLHAWRHSDTAAAKLDEIEAVLGDAEVGVVVDLMEQYRWLRRAWHRLVMHPSYEAACLHVAERRRALARTTVERVVDLLLQRADYRAAWAAWSAARPTSLAMNEATTGRLRVAARAVLVAPETKSSAFLATLRFLASAPDGAHVVDRLAVALTSRVARARSWPGLTHWSPPAWTEQQWLEATSSPDAAAVVRRFVREGLPTAPTQMFSREARKLVRFLYEIVDLSAEFDALVIAIDEHQDVAWSIALGAVQSRTADIEAIVAKATAIDAEVTSWWARIAAKGDDDNDAYWEHFSEVARERNEPARALIDAVLDERGRSGARDWASHRSERLVFKRFAERASAEELDLEVIDRVLGASPEDTRAAIAMSVARRTNERRWDAAALLVRVPANDWPPILSALFRDAGDDDLPACGVEAVSLVASFAAALLPLDRVALVHDLGDSATSFVAEAILQATSARERRALAALRLRGSAIHGEALPIVEAIAASKHAAAIAALEALRNVGLRVVERAAACFRSATHQDARCSYLAILGSLLNDRTEGDAARTVVREALSDLYAKVRTAAVEFLAQLNDGAVVEAIALLAEDPAARVRIAVAEAMGGRTQPIAEAVLVKLLADSQDTSVAARHGYPEPDETEYGVALAAASALQHAQPWSPTLVTAVAAFLASSAPTAQDTSIRELLTEEQLSAAEESHR